MATMRDVAKRAGVSVATVSAVINDSAYVSPELRSRVLESIDELNYKRNVLAKFLRYQRTATIGVVIQGVQNPFYPVLIKGIEDAAWKHQYIICLSNSNGEAERETAFLESMLQRKVDGVLFATSYLDNNPALDLLEREKVKYVLINRRPKVYTGNFVGLDNVQAGYIAAKHLIKLQRRRLALVEGPPNYSTSEERTQGFMQALEEHGITLYPDHKIRGYYSEEGGYEAAKKLFASPSNQPDGIFCSNDLMAFGVMDFMLEQGLSVPSDVSIVGCDNIFFSKSYRIPLTTVDYPTYDMGSMAVEMLLEMINAEEALEPQTYILKPQLIIRQSCGANPEEGFNDSFK